MGIPVTILTGYLGAGKTTLLNHVLAHAAGLRVAVLVNDFGAVNIDAGLIAARDGDTISLSNGCVCCSIEDDLAGALEDQVRRDPAPDHILIEASGVAEPARMLRYVVRPGLVLNGIVTVADAGAGETRLRDKFVGRLVERQLAAADLIVLNKIDRAEEETLQRVVARLAALAPIARVLQAQQGVVETARLLCLDARSGGTAPAPGSRPEMPLHTSTVALPQGLDLDALRALLARMPDAVHRAKGFVRDAATGEIVVVQVSGEGHVTFAPHSRSGPPPPLVLVIIGTAADAVEAVVRDVEVLAAGGMHAVPTDPAARLRACTP